MLEITEYLKTIFEEFKSHCDKETVSVKELKDRMGRIQRNSPLLKPDEPSIYSDRTFQQLYLLKYAYVHSFEYLSMYDQLIDDLADKEEISVVSLGCGAMLDYWALTRMLDKKTPSRPAVKYSGISSVS